MTTEFPSRLVQLADILVNYSAAVKNTDRVIIEGTPLALPLIQEVAKLCYQKGAFVIPRLYHEELQYLKYQYADAKILATESPFLLHDAKTCNVFFRLGGENNTNAFAGIDPKRIQEDAKANRDAKEMMIRKRWVLFDYPTAGLAQDANMSLQEYEEFMFQACLQDWNKITADCQKVGDIMHHASEIHILGEETELTVNIKGCPSSSSVKGKKQGQHNMPDGEVFTSPNRYKTTGFIYFPWPSKRAKEVRDVRFEFQKGRIVKASTSFNQDYLDAVLKTDKLSDSLGEIAIGLNFSINKYTNNILYDEKIGGTIHMAIGAGYEEVNGDPRSAVHWDFVKDMSRGEVWFDKTLVLKNGKIIV